MSRDTLLQQDYTPLLGSMLIDSVTETLVLNFLCVWCFPRNTPHNFPHQLRPHPWVAVAIIIIVIVYANHSIKSNAHCFFSLIFFYFSISRTNSSLLNGPPALEACPPSPRPRMLGPLPVGQFARSPLRLSASALHVAPNVLVARILQSCLIVLMTLSFFFCIIDIASRPFRILP